jgi:hypothetical protein
MFKIKLTYFTTGGTESDDLDFGGVDLRRHLIDGCMSIWLSTWMDALRMDGQYTLMDGKRRIYAIADLAHSKTLLELKLRLYLGPLAERAKGLVSANYGPPQKY